MEDDGHSCCSRSFNMPIIFFNNACNKCKFRRKKKKCTTRKVISLSIHSYLTLVSSFWNQQNLMMFLLFFISHLSSCVSKWERSMKKGKEKKNVIWLESCGATSIPSDKNRITWKKKHPNILNWANETKKRELVLICVFACQSLVCALFWGHIN